MTSNDSWQSNYNQPFYQLASLPPANGKYNNNQTYRNFPTSYPQFRAPDLRGDDVPLFYRRSNSGFNGDDTSANRSDIGPRSQRHSNIGFDDDNDDSPTRRPATSPRPHRRSNIGFDDVDAATRRPVTSPRSHRRSNIGFNDDDSPSRQPGLSPRPYRRSNTGFDGNDTPSNQPVIGPRPQRRSNIGFNNHDSPNNQPAIGPRPQRNSNIGFNDDTPTNQPITVPGPHRPFVGFNNNPQTDEFNTGIGPQRNRFDPANKQNRFNPMSATSTSNQNEILVITAKIASTLQGYGVSEESLKSLPPVLLLKFQRSECELCSAPLESNAIARMHYKSKLHARNIEKWQMERQSMLDTRTNELLRVVGASPRHIRCDLCDVVFTSKSHMDAHYNGKNHSSVVQGFKKPKNAKLLLEENSLLLKQLIDRELPCLPRLKKLKVPKPEMLNSNSCKDPSLYCELCKINVTNVEQLIIHKNGKKHLLKEKMEILNYCKRDVDASGNRIGGTDLRDSGGTLNMSTVPDMTEMLYDEFSVFRTPSGAYYCNICDISLKSSYRIRRHLACISHRRSVSRKEKST